MDLTWIHSCVRTSAAGRSVCLLPVLDLVVVVQNKIAGYLAHIEVEEWETADGYPDCGGE